VELGIAFSKTHSLVYLLDLVSEVEDVCEESYIIAEELNGYAVTVRYPVEWPEPTRQQALRAVELAGKARTYFRAKLGVETW